uniref:Carboxypeptidase n=1 Tax=Tetranychus truncatus TaxID=93132 RepID=A0A3G5ANU2_9ACAR|nr:serine carboxypeptidase CPVL [Tetranychus truncatus]
MYRFVNLFLIIVAINFYGNVQCSSSKEGLLLTPLIKAGRIAEARSSARVVLPNAPQVESYSGYLTVNKETGSNLFFWFFPSKNSSVPVALWLQGGPGAASTYALFNENGPFKVESDLTLTLRKYSWTDIFSYLYIDQPAGTGFSYTENEAGYVKNQEEVGRDLYEALLQFYALFPEWRPNDFYVTGESYAGKYVPAIAYKLHQERESSGINLKGIAIGNGLVDGGLMFKYSDILYQTGLFDYNQAQKGRAIEKEIRKAAREKRWRDCFYLQDHLLAGDRVPSFFTNVTGITNYFNSLLTVNPVDTTYSDKYLAQAAVREAIHVGNRTVDPGDQVYNHLLDDFCQSVAPWLEALMDNDYEVLLYSGSLDIVVGATCTETLINTLRWKGAAGYSKTDRKIWRLDGEAVEVQGFITSFKNFHYVVVRGAGHMVPHDQPKAAFEMITKFIERKL